MFCFVFFVLFKECLQNTTLLNPMPRLPSAHLLEALEASGEEKEQKRDGAASILVQSDSERLSL